MPFGMPHAKRNGAKILYSIKWLLAYEICYYLLQINAVAFAHFVLPQTTIKQKLSVFAPLREIKRLNGYRNSKQRYSN